MQQNNLFRQPDSLNKVQSNAEEMAHYIPPKRMSRMLLDVDRKQMK
jgi:hypothetical protein